MLLTLNRRSLAVFSVFAANTPQSFFNNQFNRRRRGGSGVSKAYFRLLGCLYVQCQPYIVNVSFYAAAPEPEAYSIEAARA